MSHPVILIGGSAMVAASTVAMDVVGQAPMPLADYDGLLRLVPQSGMAIGVCLLCWWFYNQFTKLQKDFDDERKADNDRRDGVLKDALTELWRRNDEQVKRSDHQYAELITEFRTSTELNRKQNDSQFQQVLQLNRDMVLHSERVTSQLLVLQNDVKELKHLTDDRRRSALPSPDDPKFRRDRPRDGDDPGNPRA